MKSGFADPASPFQPKTAFLHSLDPSQTYTGLLHRLARVGICRPLRFRHPGDPHALEDALAFSQDGRVVAHCASAEAADGEGWIEPKSGLRGGPRLIQPPEQRQRGGKIEMR
jgi:hypothetical protein